MSITIYICGNYEILRDGEPIDCDDCENAIDRALETSHDISGIVLNVDREFSNWRGGRHKKYATYTTNLVCTHDRSPAWIKKIIDNMDGALRETLRQCISD